jgi:beta-mannosidase
MARHFFAPLLLSAVPDWDTGQVELHITNDHLTNLTGELHWEVTTAQGEHIAGGQETAAIGPNQNTKLITLDLQSILTEHGRRNLLVWLALEVEGQVVSTNLALFVRPKHLSLAPPEIAWEMAALEDGRYQINLKADSPALWVWLEVEGPRSELSDNFFHLYPGQIHTVTLKAGHPIEESAVTLHSLYDTYQPCSQ